MGIESLKNLLEKLEIQIGEKPSKSILARMKPFRSIQKARKKPRSPEEKLSPQKVKILKCVYRAGKINKLEMEAWLDVLLQVLRRSPDMDTFLTLYTRIELDIFKRRKEQRTATNKVDGEKNLGI